MTGREGNNKIVRLFLFLMKKQARKLLLAFLGTILLGAQAPSYAEEGENSESHVIKSQKSLENSSRMVELRELKFNVVNHHQ